MSNFGKIGQSVADAAILNFQTVKFHWQTVSGRHRLIIVLNVVKIGRLVVEILQFFEFSKWPSPQSWIYCNREILLAIGVERVETHQHAKFRQNRSIGCEDNKIFPCFKMAAAAILDFRNREFCLLSVCGGPRRITVPNFVKIGHSVAEILLFFEFSRWPPPPSWIFEIAKF